MSRFPGKEEVAASLVLVHGAGSGPWIFRGWSDFFRYLRVEAVDLQEGVDVSSASMDDYVKALITFAAPLPRPLLVCGWSMGGLVVAMACQSLEPEGVILIEASPPGEIQGFDEAAQLHTGIFDPEIVYGPFPQGIAARAESQLARDERKRGISVPTISPPCLVVYGSDFPEDRGQRVAELYGAESAQVDGADHWDLILRNETKIVMDDWIRSKVVH